MKLFDKMCKYEMDLASVMDDREQTRFCPQTDSRTRWNQYILNFVEMGIKIYQ